MQQALDKRTEFEASVKTLMGETPLAMQMLNEEMHKVKDNIGCLWNTVEEVKAWSQEISDTS